MMSKKILRPLLLLSIVIFLGASVACFASCSNAEEAGFMITFDDNRGASTEFNPYAVSGQVRTKADGTLEMYPNPQRVGHDFAGWYTNAECTGDRVTEETVFTADTTLYAKWEAYPMAAGSQFSGADSDPNNPFYSGQTSPNIGLQFIHKSAPSFSCEFGVDGDDGQVRRTITLNKTDAGDNEDVAYYYYGKLGYYHGFFTIEARLYFYKDGRVYAFLQAIRSTESLGTWSERGNMIVFSAENIV